MDGAHARDPNYTLERSVNRVMDRRQFLLSLALLGTPLTKPRNRRRAGTQNVALPPLTLSPPPGSYTGEAQRLTALIFGRFWDANVGMFRAPVRSAETVDSDPPHQNGYTFWPSLLAFHTLVEGEKIRRGRYKARMAQVYRGLEQYYDPQKHAYNAWRHFPGNNDTYYDDNAWGVTTLVAAYEATGDAAYRDRAQQVMEGFVSGGWDPTDTPGGVRWGTDPTKPHTADKTASATAGAALAALGLARLGIHRASNIAWAQSALTWLQRHLQDKDGLIRDGLQAPTWTVMPTKWTYNTGVPIRAYVEHYRLTHDPASLEAAKRLARAATDRNKALYDQLVRDPERRFFYDSSFFVHYLADGLLALYRVTQDAALLDEVKRNANYAYAYLRDPTDGLYFRNFRLWRIGEAQYQAWRRLTGQEHRREPDAAERSQADKDTRLPVSARPLVKTLLANAGCARLFWLLAQVQTVPHHSS